MKTLIVFYSRTGNTRKIAKELAKKTEGDLEELIDGKNRKGIFGFLKSGREAMQKKSAKIEPVKNNPASYDLIIIGTPVWSGTMSSAVRAYVLENREKIKNIAFFSTQGSEKEQRVFSDMEELSGQKPKSNLKITAKEVLAGNFEAKLEEFLSLIKS